MSTPKTFWYPKFLNAFKKCAGPKPMSRILMSLTQDTSCNIYCGILKL
jgi:hypothetical protein